MAFGEIVKTVKEIAKAAPEKIKVSLKDLDKPLNDGAGEKEKLEKNSELYSTYKERIDHTPVDGERGYYLGERGESEYIPTDKEMKELLATRGKEGITYTDGIPDFSDFSESTVEIENMTENRAENFKQCDSKCAEQWNKEGKDGKTDWTARDVKEWRQENGYTWHEKNDMKTCELIPSELNEYFGHLGGVSECKKRDAAIVSGGGSDFDE